MVDTLEHPPPSISVEAAVSLLREHYGFACTVHQLDGERDQNFRVDRADGQRFHMKVSNASEASGVADFEASALRHVEHVAPHLPVPRMIGSINGLDVTSITTSDGVTHMVRVMSWLDGSPATRPITPSLRHEMATNLADLGLALRGMFHPAAGRPLLWSLTSVPLLRSYVDSVADPHVRSLCAEYIGRFTTSIAPRLIGLRSQVIYNDLNPSNVLVRNGGSHDLVGIVDFGDIVHAPLICDVAVAAAYLLVDGDEPLAAAADFVSQYQVSVPLEVEEADVLLDLIVGRLVTTVVVTAWRARLHPENHTYITRNAAHATRHLLHLTEHLTTATATAFRNACGSSDVSRWDMSAPPITTLTARRDELLGPAYRLFYDEPVHVVRGAGVWLEDSAGRRYLDAYNNVPLVGHSHPKVVRALSTQAATLNTHTRYLHGSILDYAERVLALFPSRLDRVMFSCTGSEANELALRIAVAATGNKGVIVSRNAYHGNTSTVAQLSPSYGDVNALPEWVETVSPPDLSGGESVDDFAAQVRTAISRLQSRGIAPAALLLDAGFTSDGLFPPPIGGLVDAAEAVRNAGGVYVADEVQVGFARLGEHLWGFERGGAIPDIVTLGKPIGNGHPLSATLAGHELIEAFARETRYFNTFGGNPVSCAVGLAVLQVFEEEGLQQNSEHTGRYLHEALQSLRSSHATIREVRGTGLFAGVELRGHNDVELSDSPVASMVANAMRERGVLVGTSGPGSTTLKIRPPLPFGPTNVDHLIEALDASLHAVSA